MAEGWVNESYVQVWQDVAEALTTSKEEEHQIALELEAKLQFMTQRCKALESALGEKWDAAVALNPDIARIIDLLDADA